jgi:hypothetical protein
VGLDRKASERFRTAQHTDAEHNSHEQVSSTFPPLVRIQGKEQNHAGEEGDEMAR